MGNFWALITDTTPPSSSPLPYQICTTVKQLKWICICTTSCFVFIAVATPTGILLTSQVSIQIEYWPLSLSAVFRASQTAFTFANLFNSHSYSQLQLPKPCDISPIQRHILLYYFLMQASEEVLFLLFILISVF